MVRPCCAARLAVCAAVFIVLVTVPALLFSQGSTGTILGVVKDPSGAPVPGAKVTVNNAETDSTRTATTGDDGSYRVAALPVGRYTLRVEHEGFKTQIQEGLDRVSRTRGERDV